MADKNGYDLATYYTDAEAAAVLAAFPDAAQVGPSLVKEVAFAVDFGIIWGNATGNLAPKGYAPPYPGRCHAHPVLGHHPVRAPGNSAGQDRTGKR